MTNAPPELAALLTAYREATGLEVTLSYNRELALKDIHDRGIAPEDIRAVMQELKRRIAKGVKGYADSSIGWTNAMGDVDRLEERVLMMRQKRARLKGSAPKADVQHERQIGDIKLTVLAPPEPTQAESAANVLPGAIRDIADRIEKAG